MNLANKKRKMKIMVAILSCSKTQDRAKACEETWINNIRKPHDYFFYGDKKQSLRMKKTWNCEPDEGERRNRLPEKTYKMLKKSLDYDWDFLFKCDDDTFVNFNLLENFVKSLDSQKTLYIGGKIRQKKPIDLAYGQGGAGYMLTRNAVEKCLKKGKLFFQDTKKIKAAEDYAVGLALYEQGIHIMGCNLLATPRPKQAKQDQAVCVDQILTQKKATSHYINPQTMRLIYKKCTNL